MRALVAISLGVIVASAACLGPETPPADVCEQATRIIQRCGATLPQLDGEPCTGIARLVSRCVADEVHDCDELASLPRRLDSCLMDAGEVFLPPAEDLPFPHEAQLDGGARDAGAAPAWQGMEAAEAVGASQQRRYVTPELAAGVYLFTMTGTGNADLSVRKTVAPTADAYDCRPADETSNESCTVTLPEPGVVHVLVQGVAPSSSYTLRGRP